MLVFLMIKLYASISINHTDKIIRHWHLSELEEWQYLSLNKIFTHMLPYLDKGIESGVDAILVEAEKTYILPKDLFRFNLPFKNGNLDLSLISNRTYFPRLGITSINKVSKIKLINAAAHLKLKHPHASMHPYVLYGRKLVQRNCAFCHNTNISTLWDKPMPHKEFQDKRSYLKAYFNNVSKP